MVVFLQKSENHAKRIESGETTLARLDAAEEQGRISGGRIHVEASIITATEAGAKGEDRKTNRLWKVCIIDKKR